MIRLIDDHRVTYGLEPQSGSRPICKVLPIAPSTQVFGPAPDVVDTIIDGRQPEGRTKGALKPAGKSIMRRGANTRKPGGGENSPPEHPLAPSFFWLFARWGVMRLETNQGEP